MSGSSPFDTPGKRAVRELWNTPVLKLLNSDHGFRYRYMGLPGIDLLDVKLWRDIIDEVIAFEIPAPPTRRDPQGRRRILELRRQFQLLSLPGYAFYGPMEEVIILRRDRDGKKYEPDKVITLYNLDFCDEISSRIDTTEQGRQVWRFEAIRQILRDQRDCYQKYGGPTMFILLLTVRDQMDVGKLRSYLSANLYADTRVYLDACEAIAPLPTNGFVLGTHSWALKAFIHDALRQYLANPHISAYFFPLLKYQGNPVRLGHEGFLESPMLHCMLLCRFDEQQSPHPSFMPDAYLGGVTSVRAGESVLTWDQEPGESAPPTSPPDSIAWLSGATGLLSD